MCKGVGGFHLSMPTRGLVLELSLVSYCSSYPHRKQWGLLTAVLGIYPSGLPFTGMFGLSLGADFSPRGPPGSIAHPLSLRQCPPSKIMPSLFSPPGTEMAGMIAYPLCSCQLLLHKLHQPAFPTGRSLWFSRLILEDKKTEYWLFLSILTVTIPISFECLWLSRRRVVYNGAQKRKAQRLIF